MKVVQINAVYDKGSTGRIIKEMHHALIECGHESHVFTADYRQNEDNVYRIGNRIDWKIHGLLSRVFGLQGYFSHLATMRLVKSLKSISPDVVHLHNTHANYLNLKMLIKYLNANNIATVITLHDCWYFTGKCMHYTAEGCYRWKDSCGNCPKLHTDNHSWLFDRTGKMLSDKRKLFSSIAKLGVIGVSDWITAEAKQSFLAGAAIVKRIYNWIDLEAFTPCKADIHKKYNLPANKSLILCIGAGWKKSTDRFNDMIRLAEILPEHIHIVLAGHLQENVVLPSNITSIGYVDKIEDLAQLYSSVAVYVHMSREDTFGKVIAEALACGTPAVVFESTACPEIVGNGCGYVVPTGDIESMCNAICNVVKNGKDSYCSSCIAHAKENFEKEKLIYQTIKLYKELLEQR